MMEATGQIEYRARLRRKKVYGREETEGGGLKFELKIVGHDMSCSSWCALGV